MKNKNYRQKKLKDQLEQKRREGKKELVWNLTPEKRREIQELGYDVEPYLYEIKTRTFYNIRALDNTLLKDLHYMNKRSKKFEIRKLKKDEMKVLNEFGISYRPIKFKIYLYRNRNRNSNNYI